MELTFPNIIPKADPAASDNKAFLDIFKKILGAVNDNIKPALSKMNEKTSNVVNNIIGMAKMTATTTKIFKKQNQVEETDKAKNIKQKKDWRKVLGGKWFDKAGSMLKKMATTSFIGQLVMLFILLKTGILKAFLPWALHVIGDVISSIIKAIPDILKFVWGILTNTIPKILIQIFDSIFVALGLSKETREKIKPFTDALAKFLPIMLVIIFVVTKILPIIVAIKTAVLAIGTILGIIFSPIGLIIAAIVLIGFLVWKFRDELKEFFTKTLPNWFFDVIASVKSFFTETIPGFFTGLIDGILGWFGGLFSWFGSNRNKEADAQKKAGDGLLKRTFKWFDNLIKGVRQRVRNFFSIFTDPVLKFVKGLVESLKPILDKLDPVIQAVAKVINTFNDILKSVVIAMRDGLESIIIWFMTVAHIGVFDYFMKTGKAANGGREEIATNMAIAYRSGMIGQAGGGAISEVANIDTRKAIAQKQQGESDIDAILKYLKNDKDKAQQIQQKTNDYRKNIDAGVSVTQTRTPIVGQ